jgi:hypothetical protein
VEGDSPTPFTGHLRKSFSERVKRLAWGLLVTRVIASYPNTRPSTGGVPSVGGLIRFRGTARTTSKGRFGTIGGCTRISSVLSTEF